MRLSFVAAVLAVGGEVSASVLPRQNGLAPKLPISAFLPTSATPITIDEALAGAANDTGETPPVDPNFRLTAGTQCANPRVRVEWDSASADQRNQYISAIKCLMGRPRSGQFSQAQNRYEDFVALHQTLTPNVHGNAKFLLWHRYYLWTFEQVLRSECGFTGPLLWFDETRYSGRFSQSSIFSGTYMGAIALGGNCVTNGQFANTNLNVGPGSSNVRHCLARDGDASETANTNAAMVDACNARTNYADMASCAEGGAHAWGHNGIGAVMQDVYASPGDPVFWLHHGFIDRNFRIWQNRDSARVNSINGNGPGGVPLTMDTGINVYGIRADVKIRDILDTTTTTLCYKYNY